MWSEKEEKQREIDSAKAEITQAEALKVLLSNNTLASEIRISGMVMGVCENKWLLTVVNNQIEELYKFLDGQPNLWE